MLGHRDSLRADAIDPAVLEVEVDKPLRKTHLAGPGGVVAVGLPVAPIEQVAAQSEPRPWVASACTSPAHLAAGCATWCRPTRCAMGDQTGQSRWRQVAWLPGPNGGYTVYRCGAPVGMAISNAKRSSQTREAIELLLFCT